jgi:hypothetical protein
VNQNKVDHQLPKAKGVNCTWAEENLGVGQWNVLSQDYRDYCTTS